MKSSSITQLVSKAATTISNVLYYSSDRERMRGEIGNLITEKHAAESKLACLTFQHEGLLAEYNELRAEAQAQLSQINSQKKQIAEAAESRKLVEAVAVIKSFLS